MNSEIKKIFVDRSTLVEVIDALEANHVFYTPIALRRKNGGWDEFEMDAIERNKKVLALIKGLLN